MYSTLINYPQYLLEGQTHASYLQKGNYSNIPTRVSFFSGTARDSVLRAAAIFVSGYGLVLFATDYPHYLSLDTV